MKREVAIDFACNDPVGGLFAGRVYMASVGAHGVEIEADRDFTFSLIKDVRGRWFIRLHRRKFRVLQEVSWYGNWCWNRYWMPRAEAKRLIGILRDSGHWRCTCAPCHWFDWFNREGRFSAVGDADERP